MRFLAIAFTLASAVTGLAVPPTTAHTEAFGDAILVSAYSEKDWKGDVLQIGHTRDVYDHPEEDGSTAICFNVYHNFVSSVLLTPFQYPDLGGMRPSGCMLYSEDNCQGDSAWIQQATWMDVNKLTDLDNYGFDKRTSSLKCYLKGSW